MKKTLMILTAAALLLTGCSKKSDSEPKPQEPIGVTTFPTEPVFRDLNGDSFTPIKVNAIRQDVSQQLEMLSDVTFSTVHSTREWSSEEFIERYKYKITENMYVQTHINRIDTDGETIYFLAGCNDAFCSEQYISSAFYAYSIFKYRISDGEMNEIFNCSDLESTSFCSGIKLLNNKLWFAVEELEYFESDHAEFKLMCIDTESGKIVKEISFGEFWDLDYSPDRLILHYWSDKSKKHIYSEYIPETDTIEEIAESTDDNVFFTDSGIVSDEVDDEGCCIVTGEDFRLETGLKGRLAAAGGQNITITRRNDDVIHTFNLEKMERYDIDLSGLGSDMIVTSDGNDLIVSSSGSLYHYYLMPELGACWLIQTSKNPSHLFSTGDAFVSFVDDEYTQTISIKKIKKPE